MKTPKNAIVANQAKKLKTAKQIDSFSEISFRGDTIMKKKTIANNELNFGQLARQVNQGQVRHKHIKKQNSRMTNSDITIESLSDNEKP